MRKILTLGLIVTGVGFILGKDTKPAIATPTIGGLRKDITVKIEEDLYGIDLSFEVDEKVRDEVSLSSEFVRQIFADVNKKYRHKNVRIIIKRMSHGNAKDLVVDERAFEGMPLSKLTVEGSIRIRPFAFKNCVNLRQCFGSGKISIESSAFSGCMALEKISLDGGISVGSEAFAGCLALIKVTLDGVINVEEFAFKNCKSLEKVAADGTVNIEKFAFQGCTALKKFTVDGVKKDAFDGCPNVEKKFDGLVSCGDGSTDDN